MLLHLVHNSRITRDEKREPVVGVGFDGQRISWDELNWQRKIWIKNVIKVTSPSCAMPRMPWSNHPSHNETKWMHTLFTLIFWKCSGCSKKTTLGQDMHSCLFYSVNLQQGRLTSTRCIPWGTGSMSCAILLIAHTAQGAFNKLMRDYQESISEYCMHILNAYSKLPKRLLHKNAHCVQ